mmetsp:Transcript_2858/g.7682  ORF Transcript_2858/g.7682 Transcript_2858/m.7682 type:complete len:229 (+) Transcript_2858:980-1666(+)
MPSSVADSSAIRPPIPRPIADRCDLPASPRILCRSSKMPSSVNLSSSFIPAPESELWCLFAAHLLTCFLSKMPSFVADSLAMNPRPIWPFSVAPRSPGRCRRPSLSYMPGFRPRRVSPPSWKIPSSVLPFSACNTPSLKPMWDLASRISSLNRPSWKMPSLMCLESGAKVTPEKCDSKSRPLCSVLARRLWSTLYSPPSSSGSKDLISRASSGRARGSFLPTPSLLDS